MDLVKEALKSIKTNKEIILETVDEYTLYCFYCGFEIVPGKVYSAPYRQDDKPSFTIYETKYDHIDYMWKDQATGESGDIFKLIKKLFNYKTDDDSFIRISSDFDLHLYDETANTRIQQPKLYLYERKLQVPAKIRVRTKRWTEEGLNFWSKININSSLLQLYNVDQLDFFWTFSEQQYPYTAPEPTFSYRIGEYYQIYSPYNPKAYKFRNDLPENYFFGYLQLPQTGDILIIDKSMKDVIFCRSLGLMAVAPKSETTMIPENKMLELKSRFKDIYLMLDNDPAGIKATEKYMAMYPWLKPRFLVNYKDKTDMCNAVGVEETKKIVYNLL